MNEGSKKWLIKSMGFGAGFALMLAIIGVGGLWYASRPKPPKPPKPWNRRAIRTDFLEPGTSSDSGKINLFYSLTNTTDTDYRIDSLDNITIAGLQKGSDALYFADPSALSFEVPLIIPAHRQTVTILHLSLLSAHMSVSDDASDAAVTDYKKKVMIFLQTKYANLGGFTFLDDETRYEIDFPLP